MEEKNGIWGAALACLPERIRRAVEQTSADGRGVEEIRIRTHGLCTLTVGGKSVSCGIAASAEETAQTVSLLCGGSLYAHTDSIREGVIASENGIRAGIAGAASPDGEKVRSVRDLSSVCLRLPKRCPGAADPILPYAGRGESVLVWSPPGMGKTTVLREAAAVLAGKRYLRRVAVVDTRFELGAGLEADGPLTADFYRGWPRSAGMEAAVRTMSPEILICDELAGEADCRAVGRVLDAGVTALCSVHAGDLGAVERHPLVKDGLFRTLCGILPACRDPQRAEREAGQASAGSRFRLAANAVRGERRIEVRVLA